MLEGQRHIGTHSRPPRLSESDGGQVGTIIIDPGHGGDDNGATWGFVEEDDVNLSVAYLLYYELQAKGYRAHLTRWQDRNVSLQDRVRFAKTSDADLFVSIHCDAYHHETAKGMSTHIHPHCSKQSERVAENIQNALISRFPEHTNRGVKHSDFYVLRKTWSPAVLVECEFLSNPGTRKFLREPENQLGLARAIATGIEALRAG